MTSQTTSRKPATQAQFDFIKKLLDERDYSAIADHVQWARGIATEGRLSSMGASDLITQLRAQPFKSNRPRNDHDGLKFPNVPAGHYALRNVPGYKNMIVFYRVDRPEQGKWAGRIFVKQFKSDQLLRVAGEGATKVLNMIAADPRAAASLYGQESKRCARCNRKLTDDVSRDRGVGPDCAEIWGWV